MKILHNIHGHSDLAALNEEQRVQLCAEIREFLVSHVSKTGGHLASNLGVVELTVAIETVFDTASDRLVFDVGHQSYVHKLLTDRQADFSSLRQFGGMAGFPKPSESTTDAFTAGHASSSVSIALGMARARTLMGEKYHVITLLGDGAATGGMVYEGLNDASVSNEPMIVILNDNALSIDHNVGGMASHLSNLRTKEKYLGMKRRYRGFMSRIPGGRVIFRITRGIKDRIRRMLIPTTIFESMGFSYLGPVDGHDVEHLIYLLRIAKETKRPILLHVMTKKGKGYAPAEEHPKLFHGVGAFDAATGEVPQKNTDTFSDAFGRTLCTLAAEDKRICAITAAMPGGTGLLDFKKQYPQRLFDVGIAEEHAVSMAAGLAKQGMVPVVALYSTFLQRAYDMILQDICLQRLHVVLAVDRAGLVGEDGETHHGVFDIGFLRHAPGMTVLCPASINEAEKMMTWAVQECDGPVAVRYPRGGNGSFDGCMWSPDTDVVCHKEGEGIAILTYGTLIDNAISAAEKLQEKGICAKVLRLTKVSPIPTAALREQLAGCKHCVVLEETCESSGVGDSVAAALQDVCSFSYLNLGDGFTTHGKIAQLHKLCGLDADSVAEHLQEVLKNEN
ncbi:MAG: 1-deoxy-D-xylulose-5-phosphate synthase [Oscillospiraceae bacterium]|nr:1-deoxy-D-xylulose-5-phosphate synthase [Oscillospiraceae bacterium]